MRWFKLSSTNAQSKILPDLIALCIFLAAIQYCWIAERTSLFEKTSKFVDARLFLILTGVSFVATLRSWASTATPGQLDPFNSGPNVALLPRVQTEEWKGWMQAVILLYHYFGLSQNLPIYQIIRVLIASYMFLTGYSHTSYFLKTNDFSIERTKKTLLRLNLLSCALAYALDKRWQFYYFPGLTSFWYLVILVSMRCASTPSRDRNTWRVCISLGASCVLIQSLLYSQSGNLALEWYLHLVASIGGPQIDAREFIFRLKLDSLMPYWGAFFAVYAAKMGNSTVEEPSTPVRPRYQKVLAVHAPWLAICVLVQYFLAIQLFQDKITSNAWHPLLSIIPVTMILVARNANARLRRGHNRIFEWLGSISLELYILQSHVWLINNNKALLHTAILDRISQTFFGYTPLWIIGVDKMILTAVFLLVSHFTAYASKILVEWLANGSKKILAMLLFACWMLNIHWDRLTQ